MPTGSWIVALVEIIFYIPTAIPTFYCLWRHRKHGLLGWIFLSAFIVLQVTGSGIILSAGENGIPSSIGTILISVGLSPLLLGIAGIIHEWARLSGVLRTENASKMAWILTLLYHVGVAGGIAIYATGASNAASNPSEAASGDTLAQAGVLILLALWLVLYVVFGLVANKLRPSIPCKALAWTLSISLVLLGVRLVYATVATFGDDRGVYNPVTGSIALKVIFEFLPGALVMLVMITGGVMSLPYLEEKDTRTQYLPQTRGRGGVV